MLKRFLKSLFKKNMTFYSMNFIDFEEIEDLIGWNLSFEISKYETLKEIGRLDLFDLF